MGNWFEDTWNEAKEEIGNAKFTTAPLDWILPGTPIEDALWGADSEDPVAKAAKNAKKTYGKIATDLKNAGAVTLLDQYLPTFKKAQAAAEDIGKPWAFQSTLQADRHDILATAARNNLSLGWQNEALRQNTLDQARENQRIASGLAMDKTNAQLALLSGTTTLYDKLIAAKTGKAQAGLQAAQIQSQAQAAYGQGLGSLVGTLLTLGATAVGGPAAGVAVGAATQAATQAAPGERGYQEQYPGTGY